MSGDPKFIASASAGYEHDPLLTPEQVANEVKYLDRLGLGSLVQKAAVAARYPHWRRPWQGRNPALPSQQNRGIHHRTRATFCASA